MKKFFTLIAAVAMAVSVNAQVLKFDAPYAAGSVPSSFSNEGLVLTLTDTGNKMSVDANSQYFGTADSYVQFGHRLKSGGKTTSKLALTLTLPSDGTLKVYARSSSSTANRIVTFSQNGANLLEQTISDGAAVKVTMEGDNGPETKSVFPIYSFDVKKGEVNITCDGGTNFYGFELATSTGITNISSETSAKSGAIYNLAGQQVSKDYKGVVIQNGKKFVNK